MIQPIETIYRGYRFRSRLEARWAVFFDSLGLPFEYEKEGFRLASGSYLPDFYMPTFKAWLEIKPALPDDRALRLCSELAVETNTWTVICWGSMDDCEYDEPGFDVWHPIRDASDSSATRGIFGFSPKPALIGHFRHMGQWVRCRCDCECSWIASPCWSLQVSPWASCKECGGLHERYSVIRAYKDARSARFEHGESGVKSPPYFRAVDVPSL